MNESHSVQSLGLTLSGGGARGIIQLGVLQALDEHKIKVDQISGASIGAIIGCLYASGMAPNELLRLLSGKRFLNMFRLKASFSGLLEMKYLRDTLDKCSPDTFEELQIPLTVAATNLSAGKLKYFDSGPLHPAVMASSTIPVLFEPVVIDGESYVDGGVLNNLPVSPIRDTCDHVLAIEVNCGKFTTNLKSMKNIALEVFHLVIEKNSDEGLKLCDSLIRPKLGIEFDFLNFSRAEELFEIGYREGSQWCKSKAVKRLRHQFSS
jgi:NTE family protein